MHPLYTGPIYITAYILAITTSLWSLSKEKEILNKGRKLNNDEIKIALKLGIQYPNKVRIMEVEKITYPFTKIFKYLSHFTNISISDPIGLTLGYGIFIEENCAKNSLLVAHELVHVQQYETYKGHLPFLQEYIYQCIINGYVNAPLEIEANEKARRISINL